LKLTEKRIPNLEMHMRIDHWQCELRPDRSRKHFWCFILRQSDMAHQDVTWSSEPRSIIRNRTGGSLLWFRRTWNQ